MDNDGYKVYKDVEFEADIKGLSIVLEKNFRELSTFERWATEVNSGPCVGELYTRRNSGRTIIGSWRRRIGPSSKSS